MFAKVFSQIFDSSIADDYKLRHFFTDLLVLAEIDGVVDMTPEAIAARTRIPLDDVLGFLKELEKPDPKSRTKRDKGKRIVRLERHRDWGWRIVNYTTYRRIASDEQRREKTKARVIRFRQKKKGCNAPVTHGNASNAMQRQRQRQKQYPSGIEGVGEKGNGISADGLKAFEEFKSFRKELESSTPTQPQTLTRFGH